TVGGTGGYYHIDNGKTSVIGSLVGGGSNSSSGAHDTNSDLWLAGLDAKWELDVFGGERRQVEAAKAEEQAAAEDRRDVMVSLVAEVALDYLELRGSQQRLAIATDNLKS